MSVARIYMGKILTIASNFLFLLNFRCYPFCKVSLTCIFITNDLIAYKLILRPPMGVGGVVGTIPSLSKHIVVILRNDKSKHGRKLSNFS